MFPSVLGVHIAAGSIALASMWIPIVARKGGPAHRRAGWVFVVSMVVVAATAVVFSLAPALRIAVEGNRAWWRFAAAGFFAAWTVCNELPACVYGVVLFLWLLRLSPKQTIFAFGPAALVPLAGFFYTNYLCTGGIKPFYAGFAVGYLAYDGTHYAVHHFKQTSRIGKFLKRHHMLHHHADHDGGFGVSSPLWDYVFGTMPQIKRLAATKVSAK